MRELATAAAVLLLLCASTACTTSDPTQGVQYFPLAFADFTAAEPLRVPQPATLVFRDAATWEAFWAQYAVPAGPAPSLDFSRDMLIAVFWGSRGSGCFDFVDAIVNVRARVDALNTLGVIEVELGPLPDLGNCATPVHPLQVVTVEATITEVEFVGQVPDGR